MAVPGWGRPVHGFPATDRDSTPITEGGDRMADWEKRIGAMTLFVPDLDRARQFYQDVFGVDAQPADDDTIVLPTRDFADALSGGPPVRAADADIQRERGNA